MTRLIIDDALTMVLVAAGREASVRMDGRGRVTRAGLAAELAPDENAASLAPMLALLYEHVAEVALEADGTLALRFGGGAALEMLPHDHQIAWVVRCGAASAACIAEGRVVWE